MNDAKLAAARLWLTHPDRYPYLASALFALTPVAAPGLGTFAVDDRWRLYVDPDVLERWSVAEVAAVLVHEVHHLLRDHRGRARAIGVAPAAKLRWNFAGDAEINDDLVAEGRLTLPGTPVVPALLGGADGGLAEEYFRSIRTRDITVVVDCGSGAHGVACPWELDESDASVPAVEISEADTIRREVALAVIERDDAPAGWRRWAEQLLRSRTDWRRVLGSEIRRGLAWAAGAVDYDRARPSRRQSALGAVVLPALRRPVPEIAIVVDTSASMDDADLACALAEVDAVIRAAGVATRGIAVLACDAEAHVVKRVTSARHVELEGGGGTDMGVGIEAALALRPRPQLVVVLTDGYTPWPPASPARTKVVVGLIGDHTRADSHAPPPPPTWARTLRIEAACRADRWSSN